MVKVLHVGVGIRGGHWVDLIGRHADFEAVALVDADEAALTRAHAAAGGAVECFTDLSTALDSVSADAAVIASPSRLHAEHAMLALRAGLTVMVEKPFAETVRDAREVLRISAECRAHVMVAENYRYRPAERTVRRLVSESAIGRIDHAIVIDHRHMPSHTEGPWLAKMEYPQLQEIAIHHFDSLRCILGQRPIAMDVRVWNPANSDYEHGAATEGLLRFETARVQYVGTLCSDRFAFSLQLEGEDGMIWTDRKRVFLRTAGRRFPRPVRNVSVPQGDGEKYPREGTTSLLDSLRDLTLSGTIPETIGMDSIWNVAMLEAGKRSDRERRLVEISEVYEGSGVDVEAG